MMLTARVLRICFAGCLFSLLALGCTSGKTDDRPTAEVEGTVLIDGKPLKVGSIQFYNHSTSESYGANIQSDGTFKIEEPIPVAKYQVSITPPSSTEAPTDEGSAKQDAKNLKLNIHEAYLNPDQSGLDQDVKEGSNSFKFELTKKGPKGYIP